MSDKATVNLNIQKLFFESAHQKFRRSDFENAYGNRQSEVSANVIEELPFEVNNETASPPPHQRKSEISKLSIDNAMSWKQFLKSGNKIAVVYIDSNKNSKSKLKSFKTSEKKPKVTKNVRFKSSPVCINALFFIEKEKENFKCEEKLSKNLATTGSFKRYHWQEGDNRKR